MNALALQLDRSVTPDVVPDVSVILPVHNERENLPILLDEIEAAVALMRRSVEIIAVDDGSTDGSRELLLRLADERSTLQRRLPAADYGQAAALDAGFRAATGAIVVTLDADGQNDPADIPRLVHVLEAQHLDFVSGRHGAGRIRSSRAWFRRRSRTI